MMKKIYSWLLALSALLLSGCELRVIDYDYIDTAEVNIITDWSHSGLTAHPNGHTVIFFPQDGSAPTTKLSHSDSITVNLPLGMYDVIVFNETFEDFDYITFINRTSFHDIAAICGSSDIVRSGYEVFDEPDLLASATIPGFEVTEHMVSQTRAITRTRTKTKTKTKTKSDVTDDELYFSPGLTWTVQPTPLVYEVNVKVSVTGLDKVNSSGSFITGFSYGVYLWDGTPLSTSVTHKLTYTERTFNPGSTTDGELVGHFYSFGLHDSYSTIHSGYMMDFRAVLPDGSTYSVIRSLNDQVRESEQEYTVNFEIDVGFGGGADPPIEIPDVEPPPDESGGWQVSVGEWAEEVIQIDM